MKLEGLHAVVTGGAMGIGLATVKRLLASGARVSIWDLNQNALDAAAAELSPYSDRIFTIRCDVTNASGVYFSADQSVNALGPIDILINNAGFVKGGNFLDQDDAAWKLTVDVNLTALIYTTRAVLPGMYERNKGHIVNISSAAGTLGVSGLAVYSAAKWAVWGFTESLRHEAINLGKRGVKFSSVHPSYIATGMFEGAKIRGLGGLIVPLVKNHDVIAKAIVESALKRGNMSPKRPRSVRLAILLRGILPNRLFLAFVRFLGIHKSMEAWTGRKE